MSAENQIVKNKNEIRLPQATCQLCGSGEYQIVQRGVRHDPDREVRRCPQCTLVYLFPMPGEADLSAYYAESYYRESEEKYADQKAIEMHKLDTGEAKLRLQRMKAWLTPEFRLLEVGCGTGAFLKQVQPFVKQAVGIEPALEFREFLKKENGVSVYSSIDEAVTSEKAFDGIVLFHVLEHILDPSVFLGKLTKLLKPAGRIFIEVPNVEDALVAAYDIPAYRQFYYQKAHLYYFSPATLKTVLDQAGYDAGIEGVQRYDLSNHMRWMMTGKPGGQGHYNSLFPEHLRKSYVEALIGAGRADTLWAVCSRKQRSSE